MSYKLIPRFYYTLPFGTYLSAFFRINTQKRPLPFFDDQKLYFHNYGRTGLRLLLSSIGEKKLKVGVQAYTCHSVFKAIHKAGHQIVFIDIDEHFQMDLNDLQEKADRIDVLIVTHTFGNPEKYDEISRVIGTKKIIIEDCAHSYGSYYADGKMTGSKGAAAIFSFGLGKLPPLGQVGCSVLRQPDSFPDFDKEYGELTREGLKKRLIHSIKSMTLSIAMKRPLYGLLTRRLGKKLDGKFDFINKFGFHESTGFAFDKLLLESQAERFQKLIDHNRKNFERLKEELPHMIVENVDTAAKANAYIAPLCVDNRDELFDHLLANDIEPGKHFYQSLIWAEEFGYEKGSCPNTEKLREQIITVPIHFGVKRNQINRMCKIISEYGRAKR
ncbi:MAG: hypothetical protein Roseis2KO_37210 [Roseivirga sp.]